MTRPRPFRPDTWPASVQGMAVCPRRGLPVPFVNEIAPDGTGEFRILDDKRALLCVRHRLCAMCSKPMGSEVALIGDPVGLRDDGAFIEPPVHEQCGADALGGMCPYLAGEKVPRYDHSADPTVTIVGSLSAADLAGTGRDVPKRPVVMAVARSYTTALYPSQRGSPVMVYRPGRVVRVRRFAYGADGRLAELPPEPAPPPAPAGATVIRTPRRSVKKRKGRRS